MQKTLKIIIMLPKRDVNSWPKPEALLAKSVGGEGAIYQFPVVIPRTEHYLTAGGSSGPIQMNERLGVEIMSAAKAELGAKAWTAFEGRMSEFWEVHKTDSTVYLFFSDYMDYGWEAAILGKITERGELFRLGHRPLSDVARKGDHLRTIRRDGDPSKKAAWNGLDKDDLEALRRAFHFFSRTQFTLYSKNHWCYKKMKKDLAESLDKL